jgi:hypothetical protein
VLVFFSAAPLSFWLTLTLKAAALVATALHFKKQVMTLLLARSAPSQ